MKPWNSLTIGSPEDLYFGYAPNPVQTPKGLVIGKGRVYPEVNLTVPEGTIINRNTLPSLRKDYQEAVEKILQRAVDLHFDGIVVEFETLLEMTIDPFIGIELTKTMVDVCEQYYDRYGLKAEIRLTPNDTRDFERPPRLRTSRYLEGMFKLFEKGAEVGGTFLSIESTGGKEICDDAIMMGDLPGVLFALSVLAVRDMRFLWSHITKIAQAKGVIAGGDTACGFANTAMVLAERNYISKVFASLVRVASVVRGLIPFELGAQGPNKDCAYEGVYLKAIAGIPISMEGKTAACAHLSSVGNVAAACADLWSNESVQNIKLLGGMAPTVYAEQLMYDCRLMNQALKEGIYSIHHLQHLLIASDIYYDPQAFVLAPEVVIPIAQEIVRSQNEVEATVQGCRKALTLIQQANSQGVLYLSEREKSWASRLYDTLAQIPLTEDRFIEWILPQLPRDKWIPAEYGIAG